VVDLLQLEALEEPTEEQIEEVKLIKQQMIQKFGLPELQDEEEDEPYKITLFHENEAILDIF
jgi:hypothetical protein